MCQRRTWVLCGWLVVWLSCAAVVFAAAPASQPREWITVSPEQTDEILANPGMGWQTFHRTRTQDKNLPAWIPSTVHYARWSRRRGSSTKSSSTACWRRRARQARRSPSG